MITFAELCDQVHLVKDMILTDMVNDNDYTEEAESFRKHTYCTKYWFARISAANKKRFLAVLLSDVRSMWALSLLLKSIWNAETKDAVMSLNEQIPWSSYDQAPIDHNRTAQPAGTLAQVMTNDRKWFNNLDPEPQAILLSQLLSISGGPIIREFYRRAVLIFERSRDAQLHCIEETAVVESPHVDKTPTNVPLPKRDTKQSSFDGKTPGQARKELDAHMVTWNTTIKSLKDSLKLEELELTFKDGTKQKIWKVNRPKPEVTETVDFLQLLPSAIAKRILLYLPRAQLADYGRVNKYWAYLVEDLKLELQARVKIMAELDKMREIMMQHDNSLEVVMAVGPPPAPSSFAASQPSSVKTKAPAPHSMRRSERSVACSIRNMMPEQPKKTPLAYRPIRNLADLTERLDQRGAADESVFQWCDNLMKRQRNIRKQKKMSTAPEDMANLHREGVLDSGVHFPCPLLKKHVRVPLDPPLCKDPTGTECLKLKRNVSNPALTTISKVAVNKRFSLWTRDFSSLYPVLKIPSHLAPHV